MASSHLMLCVFDHVFTSCSRDTCLFGWSQPGEAGWSEGGLSTRLGPDEARRVGAASARQARHPGPAETGTLCVEVARGVRHHTKVNDRGV